MGDGHSDGDTTSTWRGSMIYTKQDTDDVDAKVEPAHYPKDPSPLEVIDAWGLDFLEGNVLKYLSRWRQKGGIEDLRKLSTYATKLVLRESAKLTKEK